MQTTNHILMIRPVRFGFNEQTAGNNAFQNKDAQQSDTQDLALAEFDRFAKTLTDNGVDVTIIEDSWEPHTPDSVFPNNWLSFHNNDTVCLFPMQAVNRRLERRADILDHLKKKGFSIARTLDFSKYEKEGLFLEGTGSMVLDRVERISYACLSPRTDQTVLNDFCTQMGYESLPFHATDQSGKAIYHTNVMMCIGNALAVICLDSIPDKIEREQVQNSLMASGKEIVPITFEQMNEFSGNMLELKNDKGENLMIMSDQAYRSLAAAQTATIERYCRIVTSPIKHIEANGGGSARCMIAEIHLNSMIS